MHQPSQARPGLVKAPFYIASFFWKRPTASPCGTGANRLTRPALRNRTPPANLRNLPPMVRSMSTATIQACCGLKPALGRSNRTSGARKCVQCIGCENARRNVFKGVLVGDVLTYVHCDLQSGLTTVSICQEKRAILSLASEYATKNGHFECVLFQSFHRSKRFAAPVNFELSRVTCTTTSVFKMEYVIGKGNTLFGVTRERCTNTRLDLAGDTSSAKFSGCS